MEVRFSLLDRLPFCCLIERDREGREARQPAGDAELGRREQLEAQEPSLGVEVEDRRIVKRLRSSRLFVDQPHCQKIVVLCMSDLRMRQRKGKLGPRDALVQLQLCADRLPVAVEQQCRGTLGLAGGVARCQLGKIPIERPRLGIE